MTRVTRHQELRFIVILNPNSGPGKPPWWPSNDYTREIRKLNAYENVTTIGYVRINYCQRSINQVLEDVKDYADWEADIHLPGCHVDGIFFDETPNEYSLSKACYLAEVTNAVKQNSALGARVVIHNPGCPLDIKLNDMRPQPDITVVWEEEYARLLERRSALSSHNYKGNCIMLHSVPSDRIVEETQLLRQLAKYVFITDRREGYYEHFGESWELFIEAIAN